MRGVSYPLAPVFRAEGWDGLIKNFKPELETRCAIIRFATAELVSAERCLATRTAFSDRRAGCQTSLQRGEPAGGEIMATQS